MRVADPEVQARLERFLAGAAGADTVALTAVDRLAGGSVQQNWRLDADVRGGGFAGRRRWVLRTDGATGLGLGLGRVEEFAVLRHVWGAGIAVPEPLFACDDRSLMGSPFFVVGWRPGTARGQDIVAPADEAAGEALAERLGRELAELHRLHPGPAAPACLGAPPADPAQARLHEYRRLLDASPEPHPVAEWGLRWLIRHRPEPATVVLCHGDFRTGNYLVDDKGLSAVLDWEFAGWSDPVEDIGWFFSRCWRFGADRLAAGGVGSAAAFLRGYDAIGERPVDRSRIRYWEVMAALRWLLIAVRQRDRCLVQGERSLDLALSGRRPAECEWEILRLTDDDEAAA